MDRRSDGFDIGRKTEKQTIQMYLNVSNVVWVFLLVARLAAPLVVCVVVPKGGLPTPAEPPWLPVPWANLCLARVGDWTREPVC